MSKQEREKVMSDKDRIKAWKRKDARCMYCQGQRPIETITDRLFGCCFACAGRDLTTEHVYTQLPCICCGKRIKKEHYASDITQYNVNHTNMSGGTAARIECGYGSRLDGDMYIIAICDDCLTKTKASKRITYLGNFISEI